ncbi:phosphatase PAP2 family protein [Chryseobacterium indologenes]|uniref:phosphatase PAP2 family protein n=1 Tax=Chryseobacterium indologenes TaxID=253 RepID=UPI000F4F2226|nr:phosphatase PAP2 family protein [Chryseobacterium indologenes]AYZ35649.1 phosphatase PAP2 family protein [Chryseobacterium indologenes]MBF6644410.1 phosphatase PAP2 family protein [Chryseobacterium indologenes]MBU3046616.1 phosphatase PAP2 family protein [Chryseobacterium indologenes]MEB4760011.1 phosphatase PAP2 family protein [Chryseobacterium indologenes]QQQ71886.1 phosphatase PAP2 family protein [Chryseobacterium indologenes]
MKKHSQRMLIYVIVLISAAGKVNAQNNNDSIAVQQPTDSITTAAIQKNTLNYKSLIIPAAFIGYGVAGLSVRSLKEINRDTKTEVDEHRPARTRFDDYTQFIPGLMVYGLNMAGVKGKHNFRDRTIIYASSQLIVTAFTTPLKYMVKEERPDRSNRLSFPSGHAAIAFSNAQFMFREYKDTNFWLSLSGYPFAVFTGIYRIINDKHWVGDVVAGAGFGILSTELAYWLFPKIDSLLRGKNKTKTSLSSTMVMPFYQNNTVGIGLVKNF